MKIAAMSKEVSVLLNMVCNMYENIANNDENKKELISKNHIRNEQSLKYWQSLAYVDGVINERRNGYRKKLKPTSEIKKMMREKIIQPSLFEQVEGGYRITDEEFEQLFMDHDISELLEISEFSETTEKESGDK